MKNNNQWQDELDAVALRFHTIGCWVGIIANLVWIPMDYMAVPHLWEFWAIMRVTVSALSLAGLLLKDKLKLGPEGIIYIPAMSLCIISGYMYHVVDYETYQVNTLGYCGLFIGIGMLILWKIKHSFILIGSTLVSNVIFYWLFSDLTVSQALTGGGVVSLTVAVLSIILIQNRYSLTKTEIKARLELARSKEVIQEKNQSITSSINYAKRIQEAFLPSLKEINNAFPQNFILYLPKDIVSGDFYWVHEIKRKVKGKPEHYVIWAVADCTGHGVPGAFMSLIGISLLNEIVIKRQTLDTAQILNEMRQQIIEELGESGETGGVKDGMDISLCIYDKINNTLRYSGANNPVYLIKNGELEQIKGDRQPIGYHIYEHPFTQHEVSLNNGDQVYIFSDGFADQFGGDRNKKFTYQRFRELILNLHTAPIADQKTQMADTFEAWKQDQEQIDDICVIGVRI